MTSVKMKIAGKEFFDFFNVDIRYSMEAFTRDFSLAEVSPREVTDSLRPVMVIDPRGIASDTYLP